jgi:hypothetical protein
LIDFQLPRKKEERGARIIAGRRFSSNETLLSNKVIDNVTI